MILERFIKYLIYFLMGFFIVLLLAPAYAGPDVEQETIVSTGDNMAENSVSINGSRSYGIGMGDVDIAQCYRSYQLLIWQDSKINPLCLADSYDNKGLHSMAAMIRCDLKLIRKHFDSEDACLSANTMMFHVEPQPVMAEPENDDEDNERFDALYARLSDLETQRTEDANSARKAAARANAAARQAEQVEVERKEYAQQIIEELAEWK